MKKVHDSIAGAVFFSVLLMIPLWTGMKEIMDFCFFVALGICDGLLILRAFLPIWSYDERGIETRGITCLGKKRFYEWKQVYGIWGPQGSGPYIPFYIRIKLDDGSMGGGTAVTLSRFRFSEEDFKTLSDVIDYARKNNPDIKIEYMVSEKLNDLSWRFKR